ncbi:MAG: ABC transporter permease [Caldimicrobium sp.]|nr:ABC transporter permease [Caldimicrobium sp.]MCX7873041.1 ABC transporter permease [Caldimicrobium sp.]MDW8094856.1 ABC transporter permease [Caldimicrobium sp.]
MLRRIVETKQGLFSLVILMTLLFIALFGPSFYPYHPNEINVHAILQGPSLKHPLGTDLLGRDLLSRMIYGARISLQVSVVAVGISLVIGIVLGTLAGYLGGLVDQIISRLIDIMLCFPTIFLILAVIAYLEPSIINIMIVIGLTSWMGVARLIRAEFLTLKEREFVLAAKIYGASTFRIIFRHILPNALPPVLVSASLGMGQAILIESALSFLGIGVQPPTPSWGNLLIEGKETLEIAWWLSIFPGLAILLTVLAFLLLGETLQDVLNPRRR